MIVKKQRSANKNLSAVTASAPAKTILFGEHFVVYGEPAIVLAIEKRAYATATRRSDTHINVVSKNLGLSHCFENDCSLADKDRKDVYAQLEPVVITVNEVLSRYYERKIGVNVEIRSSIPIAAGLGSSAAVAVATTLAVSELFNLKLTLKEIFQIAYDAEKLIHGTPSGIDPLIATYGGIIIYQKDRYFTSVELKTEFPFVVGNTCIERSTGRLVAEVRRMYDSYPNIVKPIIKSGGQIAQVAAKMLQEGNLKTLGELMNVNHSLLQAVGVSNEALDKLVFAARKAGALGAKLTGAGGGGCMIALSEPQNLKAVKNAIEQAAGKAFVAKKALDGVRVERQN
ncbi:MAG: mevalonate kinase [Candidatus Bathyarchaeia archaeon]